MGLRYFLGKRREAYKEHRIVALAKRNGRRKNAAFLLGTPLHPNMGDQAIALAELEFFQKNGQRVAEIPSPMIEKNLDIWKKIIGTKRIYIHGGGFVGTLWPEEEAMLEYVIANFLHNEIIILPQTVYFDQVDDNVKRLNELFGKHGNVTLCARETYSYEFACQHLSNAKVLLVPDMVLSANWFKDRQKKRTDVVFCMRSDLEKTISEETVRKLKTLVAEYDPQARIIFTDTVGEKRIYPNRRKDKLLRMLGVFASAKLVITDRLHGMVLSAMTNTPTLAFSNCNYKVKGIYDWISDNTFLAYCDDTTDIEARFAELIRAENCQYCNDAAVKAFAPLQEIVGNYHE